MKVIETGFAGLFVIEPKVFPDDRGYFFESYNHSRYSEFGMDTKFVQDNESKSTYGVVRGLHFQVGDYAQTKLIRVISGKILDVVLDLRSKSKTYGSCYAVELTGENKRQFYIPKGFAHGFSVLSKEAIVNYKCDNFYHKDSERSVNLFDKDLDIDWKVKETDRIISEKDKISPNFSDLDVFF